MAKRLSASSHRGKRIGVSAESTFSKPLGKPQRAVLARMSARQKQGDDSNIDYSDIPRLTGTQTAEFRRSPKILVAARIDRGVYEWLQRFGKGYSTRINGIPARS